MTRRDTRLQPNYQVMAEFRYQIRRFLRFSEQTAREAGLEPQQYQLMLVLKASPESFRRRVREIADRLQIQHHSTVELVDRLVRRGMVRRRRGTEDRREVMVELTPKGEKVLRELAMRHNEELGRVGPEMVNALRRVIRDSARISPAGLQPQKRAPSRHVKGNK